MTTKNMGAEGFKWFVGVVEDREDPLKLGRVRVRAHNVHDDSIRIPTADLPWAFCINPIQSSSLKQVGISPTGIQVGTTVVGFFADGNETQIPLVFGTLPGIPDAGHDVSPLAREVQALAKSQLGPEPSSAYGAKYPFNKVLSTESGHAIEIDDTPSKERLHVYHKSGTYTEIDSRGQRVVKVVNDDYEIVAGKKEVFVKGNVNIVVKGNVTMRVDGNYNLDIGGRCDIKSGGNMTLRAPRIDLN